MSQGLNYVIPLCKVYVASGIVTNQNCAHKSEVGVLLHSMIGLLLPNLQIRRLEYVSCSHHVYCALTGSCSQVVNACLTGIYKVLNGQVLNIPSEVGVLLWCCGVLDGPV